jgi:hypothetical protein
VDHLYHFSASAICNLNALKKHENKAFSTRLQLRVSDESDAWALQRVKNTSLANQKE